MEFIDGKFMKQNASYITKYISKIPNFEIKLKKNYTYFGIL